MSEEIRAGVEKALPEWATAIGAAQVTVEERTLRLSEQATFASTGRLLALLRPGTVAETQEIVRIAARHRLPLNVFSRGRNYGYSSNGPTAGTSVGCDLSRLSDITEFNEELGFVRVQAGVTFGQLYAFLESKASTRFFPVTGGPADGSVLANHVERGYGIGPGTDRFHHSCRYEVVLPNGERLETGFGRFPECRIANLMKTGVGPSLDGMFTQSNLGIVTALTVWLPRKPKHRATVCITIPEPERIGDWMEFVCRASSDGLIDDGSALALNDYKLASFFGSRGTVQREGSAEGVTREQLKVISSGWGQASWVMLLGLTAPTSRILGGITDEICARARTLRRGSERVIALTRTRARLLELSSRMLSEPNKSRLRTLLSASYLQSPLFGFAVNDPLRTVYWAKPAVPSAPLELIRDRVGLLWVSVPVPAKAPEITEVCMTIEKGLLDFGFEPATQVTTMSERLVRVITPIAYDRDNPGSDQRAIDCSARVYRTLREKGFYTYRLTPLSMSDYAAIGPAHQAVAQGLKSLLDPAGVLDPARYPAISGE